MKKFRIIEETGSKTGRKSFIVERQKTFLGFTWWSPETIYHLDCEMTLSFQKLREAGEYCNKASETMERVEHFYN